MRRKARFTVAAALIVLVGGTVSGHGGGLWDLSISELLELEVSAPSRSERRLADSPTALTVYERDEIRSLGVRYLHELLEYVPGFQQSLDVSVAGQRHALSARGSVEFHSPGVLVLRDGRRLNDVYTRGAPLFARWISLEHVVRVEVIRGPGSSLYGSNALVGVINLVTDGLESRYVLGATGAHRERRAAFAWQDIEGAFEIAVNAELLADDGDSRPVFDRFGRSTASADPRRFEDFDIRVARGGTSLSFHAQRRSFDDFYNVGGTIGNGLNRHEALQRSIALVHARSSGRLGSRFTAEYREADWDFVFLQAPAGTGPFQDGDFLLGGRLDQRIVTLSYEGTATLNPKHTLSFGAELVRGELPQAQLQSTYDLADPSNWYGEVRVLETRFAREETTRNRGAYLEHVWEPNDRIRTRFGVRGDDDSFTDTEVSLRAGVDVQLTGAHRLSLLAGQAYRSPGLGELFLENQPVILGNPDLRSTTLDTVELGWRMTTDHSLVSLGVFRNEIGDAIVSVPTASPGVAQFRNAGDQQTTGAELDSTFVLGDRTRLRIGAAHLFENQTNLAATPNSPAPEEYFSETFGYAVLQRRAGRVDLGVGVRWRDRARALDAGGDPLLDARASIPFGERGLIWIRVTNLTDRQVDSIASGGGLGADGAGVVQRRIPLRDRSWSVGLERRF